jgi:RNA polymerase sigma-70 factor (ECF subfamily)
MAGIDTPLSLLDRLARHDDAEAWGQFSRLYEPLIRRWVGRLVSQPDAVDDVTQEVLKALLEGLPTFEHNLRPGAFRAWLRSIAVHRVRRQWRSQHQHTGAAPPSELSQLEDSDSGLSRLWDQEHDRHVLGMLLEKVRADLDARTWNVFHRLVFEEVPARDVARDLGISANAVYIAKARVLKRLRLEAKGLIE